MRHLDLVYMADYLHSLVLLGFFIFFFKPSLIVPFGMFSVRIQKFPLQPTFSRTSWQELGAVHVLATQ
jgi:hypothetical protein